MSRAEARGERERGDLMRGVGDVAALPMALTLVTLPIELFVLLLLLGRKAGESGLWAIRPDTPRHDGDAPADGRID